MSSTTQPPPDDRPEGTDSQQSRSIFGTLTTPPATKFNGSKKEEESILRVIRANCPSIIKLILQQEIHSKGDNKGNIHYHFLVCNKTGIRQSKLRKFRDSLSTLHPGRHDVQFAKSVSQVEKYIFKDYLIHLPFTEGYSESDIISLQVVADQTHPPPVKTTNANKYEAEILERTIEFMVTNDYSINFYTRGIHGRGGKDRSSKDVSIFFEQLTKETTIPEDYGQRGVKLIRDYITSTDLYLLPYFTPDRNYISFNNAVYGFTEGKHYELDDPAISGISPIRHFDMEFPPAAPTAYFFLIHNHKWNMPGFVEKYAAMFKPKNRREACMYLWGPPLTGKSMFYIPLTEVFGDLVGYYTKDSNFSLSNLPDKLLAVLDEVNIWDSKDLQMQLVKKLLEGTEFTVARKNREAGAVKPIHAFIATNFEPPQPVDDAGKRDFHIEAILSRIHPYETKDISNRDADVIRTTASDQAAGWAVYCTQKHPYITVPPEYLS